MSIVVFLVFWAAASIVTVESYRQDFRETSEPLGEIKDLALGSTWAFVLLGISASLMLLFLKRRIGLVLGWLAVSAIAISLWAVSLSAALQPYYLLDDGQRWAVSVDIAIGILLRLIVIVFYITALRKYARWLIAREVDDRPPPP